MRQSVRAIGLFFARLIGTRLVDFQTGRDLGKALIVPWRGKIHVIGLNEAVRSVFLPQKRLTYWKQEIGFTTQPPPDFSNERSKISATRGENAKS
jgi:hypothetical protein